MRHAAATAATAAAVAAVAGDAAAATRCAAILDFTASCDAADGLLTVPSDGFSFAATCRGYCFGTAVTIRQRPCAFCTGERCQTGVDMRGETMVCCNEDACSAACGAPEKGCRYVANSEGGRGNGMG